MANKGGVALATIKDIARIAGVSLSTVSLVLNGKSEESRIPPATQKRVWDAVKELDYRPNIAARRLRGEPGEHPLVIGLFWTSDFRAPMLMRFLRGLQKRVEMSDRKIEIVIHTYENDALDKVASFQKLSMFNAAIICNISEKDQAYLEKNHFLLPIILYNRQSQVYSAVHIEDHLLGNMAAEVLVSRGHKNAAVISSKAVFAGMGVRMDSFVSKAVKNGMQVESIEVDNSMSGGFEGALSLLRRPSRPDCLFCASDAIAIGALRAMYKEGVRIPEDVEVISVGNGDKDLEEYAVVSLSVVHIPMEKMAYACFDLVMDTIDHRINLPKSVIMPVEYIPRESCGPLIE